MIVFMPTPQRKPKTRHCRVSSEEMQLVRHLSHE